MSSTAVDLVKSIGLGATLTALIPVLVTTLIPALADWQKNRNAEAKRARQLDAVTKRVSFWEQWLKVQQSTHPTEEQQQLAFEKVRDQLKSASSAVEEEFTSDLVPEDPAALFEYKRRRYFPLKRWLLLYDPEGWYSRFLRIGFWSYMLMAVLLLRQLYHYVAHGGAIDGRRLYYPGMAWICCLLLYVISRAIEGPQKIASYAK